MDLLLLTYTILIGFGLAMDAFSVSLANGLHEPHMKWMKVQGIAGTFAFFQWLMPLAGWYCVHKIVELFYFFAPYIPFIAFGMLSFIGITMIKEGLLGTAEEIDRKISAKMIFWQGLATSVDALSVGFMIEEIDGATAFLCSLVIGAVTFVICLSGIVLGKKFGMKF